MADLKQALQWLAEGKKIRRKQWVPSCYITIVDDEVQDEDGNEVSALICGNDWELFIPKPDYDPNYVALNKDPLIEYADYIVWSDSGSRDFALWRDEEFYSLSSRGVLPLKVKYWKKLPTFEEVKDE